MSYEFDSICPSVRLERKISELDLHFFKDLLHEVRQSNEAPIIGRKTKKKEKKKKGESGETKFFYLNMKVIMVV